MFQSTVEEVADMVATEKRKKSCVNTRHRMLWRMLWDLCRCICVYIDSVWFLWPQGGVVSRTPHIVLSGSITTQISLGVFSSASVLTC